MNIFCIDDYPELSLLAWNRAVRNIEEDEAFALYEANWRFVDCTKLIPKEQDLIKHLTCKYGNGVFIV